MGEFLSEHGLKVIGINPGLTGQVLFDQPVYAKLADIPHAVDMIDIFRNSETAGDVVDEALELQRLPKLIWMQLGVVNEAAAERAQEAGVVVIMDKCPKIEMMKFDL